ncbi:MAG TPA: 2-dehydropantoate 2-reductase [Rudaea sp.]|nr:2-dehydropantoate 2-reductase [Rudaea sp.]
MRILVVGAGATGGYFGGRLAAAGRDVTFLVRARRAEQLAASGLRIRSPHGDVNLASPKTVLAEGLAEPYDLVLLSCKAYDLDGAMASFAPAMGTDSMILPVLNGMRHLDALDARFGHARVLGGQCVIAATVDDDGTILHLNNVHGIAYGERDGGTSERVQRVDAALSGAGFDARLSEHIAQDMWEKWTFLAALAAGTCLMRASIGEIVAAPGGDATMRGLFDECAAIAGAHGHAPRAAFAEKALTMLSQPKSSLTASMLRDLERGGRIEADHIVGDLIARRGAGVPRSILELAYTHLKAYEARRSSGG